MTTLAEARTQVAQAGTEQKAKLRRAVKIGVGSVFGAIAFLLVTYKVATMVDGSSVQQASRSAPPAQNIVSNDCPGGTKTVEIRGTEQKTVSEKRCQVRVYIEEGSCVDVLDNKNRRIGESCRGGANQVDGIIYGLGGKGSYAVALVTPCPLGSPGRNIGSCN